MRTEAAGAARSFLFSMSFAARSMMKIVSATLVSLVLTAAPAAAQAEYPATMSGSAKIEMVPPDAKGVQGQAQPKLGDRLTIQLAAPPKQETDEEAPAVKLRQCGDKWNRKLAAYEKDLPKLKKYLAYFNKWQSYPAQRPPKSATPLLTRATYRACIYECLGDTTVSCPGGWPAEAADRK
jgi:hypothetical protein